MPGAGDSRKFKAMAKANLLPPSSSITYEGVFNENYFDNGEPEQSKLVTSENYYCTSFSPFIGK